MKWPQHLLQASVRGAAAALTGDVDGHYPESGVYEGFGLGYAYSTRYLEVGAVFDYMAVPERLDFRHTFAPAFTLRPHIPLSERFDLGATLRACYSWTRISLGDGVADERVVHTFKGPGVWIDLDARYWLTRRFALDLGPEAFLIIGQDAKGGATYFGGEADALGLGAFLRGSFAL